MYLTDIASDDENEGHTDPDGLKESRSSQRFM